MTKKEAMKALAGHKQRTEAAKAERITVPNYPWSHNPYAPHTLKPDCFPVCMHAAINAVLAELGATGL